MSRTLLVTGASGHLGRAVVNLLLRDGTDHIIAATRDPQKIADLGARGATLRSLDLNDPDLDTAVEGGPFAGADRVLLISTDTVDTGGARIRQHQRAIRAATAAKVGHIVYTSLVHAESTLNFLAPDHLATEQALAKSGLPHTILRNNLYAENLLGLLAGALATGILPTAAGDGRVAWISRTDCARAAATALAAPPGPSQCVDISGPQSWSTADLAALVTRLTGRPIVAQHLSPEALTTHLTAAGLPHGLAAVLASLDLSTAAGEFATPGNESDDLPTFLAQTLLR